MAVAMDAGRLEERSFRLPVAQDVSERQSMVSETVKRTQGGPPIREDVGPVFIVLLSISATLTGSLNSKSSAWFPAWNQPLTAIRQTASSITRAFSNIEPKNSGPGHAASWGGRGVRGASGTNFCYYS